MSKISKLEINDVFHDIKEENTRLKSELKFAQNLFEVIENYRNLLNKCLNNCVNCGQNEEIKSILNEVELCFGDKLNLAKQESIIGSQNSSNKSKIKSNNGLNSVENQIEDQKPKSYSNETSIETGLMVQNLKSIKFVTQLESKDQKKSILYPQKKPFKCLRTQKLLNIHKNRKHFSSADKSQTQIDENIVNINPNSKLLLIESKHKCNLCSKTYKHRKHLFRHFRQNHPFCDQNSLELNSGLNTSEDNQKNASNETENLSENSVPKEKRCRRKRKTLRPYTQRNRPFGCHLCKKKFSEQYILDLHINAIHSESDSKERYFCCDFNDCKYKTKNLNIFKDHRKRHLGDKQIGCLWPSCEQMFISTEEMKSHLVRHQDIRNYLCSWPGCHLSFKTQQQMKRHTYVHTFSPDQFPCDWPQCQKRFRTLTQMRRHVLTVHKGYRKYACHWPECDKKFISSGELKTHLTVHSGLKPHTCPVEGCEKRFADKCNIYKHIRTIHKKTE